MWPPLPPAKIISCSLCEVFMRKRSRARNSWFGIWADACSLGFEASSVIGLRAMKLAVGGKAAAREAQRMVSEKIEASLALQGKALSGDLGTTALNAAAKTLDHYRQKVRANQNVLPEEPLDCHVNRNENRALVMGGGDVPVAPVRRTASAVHRGHKPSSQSPSGGHLKIRMGRSRLHSERTSGSGRKQKVIS